jgi:hypothetical protein
MAKVRRNFIPASFDYIALLYLIIIDGSAALHAAHQSAQARRSTPQIVFDNVSEVKP